MGVEYSEHIKRVKAWEESANAELENSFETAKYIVDNDYLYSEGEVVWAKKQLQAFKHIAKRTKK